MIRAATARLARPLAILRALVLYATLTVVPGGCIHLLTEAATLGGRESAGHLLARHLDLPAIALALAALTRCLLARAEERDPRRALTRMLRALPYRRSKRAGYGISLALQTAFYAATFAADGPSLQPEQCLHAFLVATLCAVGAAFALRALPDALLRPLAAVYVLRVSRVARFVLHRDARVLLGRVRRYTDDYVAVAGNRPPPTASVALFAQA